MPETEASDDGKTSPAHRPTSHPPSSPRLTELKLPKNRSTGNLLAQAATARDKPRIRFSFDGGSDAEIEAISKSPIMTEHEHGLGASGLRRIRQQPPSRMTAVPSSAGSSFSAEAPSRTGSMIISLPASRSPSQAVCASPGPASPVLNFGEDLYRFPAESLHSFSFAHQSEDSLHSRQNILKRSVDFMRDRLGWASTNAGIANAQAKLSGDPEMQSVMDLLSRAKMLDQGRVDGVGLGLLEGPLTGPAEVEGENVFDRTFIPASEQLDSAAATQEGFASEPAKPVRPGGKNESKRGGGSQAGLSSHGRSCPPRRANLRRTYTDVTPLSLQTKLLEALARPYIAGDSVDGKRMQPPPSVPGESLPSLSWPNPNSAAVHGHASRWAPAAQAIFTTESESPWTILAANDLACLVFGVTKAEVRKLGILEVVREERRGWLEEKLRSPGSDAANKAGRAAQSHSQRSSPNPTSSPWAGNGVTARLLSKPSWRDRRSQTDDGSGTLVKKKAAKGSANHASNRSRGVLLCGDVVPIQKRNGALGSASLWVKEKRGGLIWVLEEISEDVAYLDVDARGTVTRSAGATSTLWGVSTTIEGTEVGVLLPHLPRRGVTHRGVDYAEVDERRHFAARVGESLYMPATVDRVVGQQSLRVSSFPHIAGMMVLSAADLRVTSSNSVFSAALFGQSTPDGLLITDLIPSFEKLMRILTEEDGVKLVDGIVVPEHSFRRARAILALREGQADAAESFLHPSGLPAVHRDGSEIKVDVQMRVVKSDSFVPDAVDENVIEEEEGDDDDDDGSLKSGVALTEMVYALWITYSRHLHASVHHATATSTSLSTPSTPPHQPSPGQTQSGIAPQDMDVDGLKIDGASASSPLRGQIGRAAAEPISTAPISTEPVSTAPISTEAIAGDDGVDIQILSPKLALTEPLTKKTISDFVILEEMGQGAYGQVKLVRYKKNTAKKMVLKYVTKRRILVDTWTRDRRLGTVPLEIHVLDYLRRDGLRHANIVEMSDFFEDDANYYIEMIPHGLPGMDLFDYIELRVNMEEAECRSIFKQVANAIYHLHTKALVVHRDIKDENVVLDGEGNIKLIDFGSAAYIKNGPFDVFVGTIVLAGRSYRGKEQDVWALGILLYTIVYKENPFYSIDEIMDHDLRVPYVMSEDSIDLIRLMLDRDVEKRGTIQQVMGHAWLKEGGDQA